MSILQRIKSAAKGLATGGVMGAIAGASGAGGRNAGKAAALARVALPSTGTFSATPFVRLASDTDLATLPQIGNAMARGMGIWPTQGLMNKFAGTQGMPGGGGASGSYAPGAQQMYGARRLFTKKGTPRRIKANGMPYAVPRMNPMNYRAARRAVTRIRGARKLLQRIERSLPRQQTRRRAA